MNAKECFSEANRWMDRTVSELRNDGDNWMAEILSKARQDLVDWFYKNKEPKDG